MQTFENHLLQNYLTKFLDKFLDRNSPWVCVIKFCSSDDATSINFEVMVPV